MGQLILIFLGCGCGGLCRYWLTLFIQESTGKLFPLGTLIVNVSGSFLIGFLVALIMTRFMEYSQSLRAFLLIGFLGGYTTFSSFSLETLTLIQTGEKMSAFIYIILSVMLGLIAVWLGAFIGRTVVL